MGSTDLYRTVDALVASGVKLLETPDTYYERGRRIPGPRRAARGAQAEGDPHRWRAGELLLQIFSENQFGPIFFEFIQRKGNEGFGEGNFKALFESIEHDQIRRGVVKS